MLDGPVHRKQIARDSKRALETMHISVEVDLVTKTAAHSMLPHPQAAARRFKPDDALLALSWTSDYVEPCCPAAATSTVGARRYCHHTAPHNPVLHILRDSDRADAINRLGLGE